MKILLYTLAFLVGVRLRQSALGRRWICKRFGHDYAQDGFESWANDDGDYFCQTTWTCCRCAKPWVHIYTLNFDEPGATTKVKMLCIPAILGPGRWE